MNQKNGGGKKKVTNIFTELPTGLEKKHHTPLIEALFECYLTDDIINVHATHYFKGDKIISSRAADNPI